MARGCILNDENRLNEDLAFFRSSFCYSAVSVLCQFPLNVLMFAFKNLFQKTIWAMQRDAKKGGGRLKKIAVGNIMKPVRKHAFLEQEALKSSLKKGEM